MTVLFKVCHIPISHEFRRYLVKLTEEEHKISSELSLIGRAQTSVTSYKGADLLSVFLSEVPQFSHLLLSPD